ncbi:MAG TPA: hypothetical protein VME19_03035 [Streptosporangiaceae bacterium]|nr:hypothetical protein [Streptosporangiaceae bacterium]
MTSYGRGGRRPGQAEPPGVAWSLMVIAAALIGGLAGAEIEHASLVITFIVSLVIGVIGVLVVARWPGRSAELTDGRHQGLDPGLPRRPPADPSAMTRPSPPRQPPEPSGAAGYTRVDPRNRPQPGYAEPQAASTVELIPFPSRRDTGQAQGAEGWWDATSAPRTPASEGRPAPAPDLSTYLDPAVTARLDSALIAQCPRCGAFKLDVDRNRDPWAFRCQACAKTWTWRPGTPWPAVRVAPRRREDWRPPPP